MNLFFIKTIYLSAVFTFVLTNPCLNLRKDKNDGLKVFTSSTGIRAEDAISLLAKRKRSINSGGFVRIIDNQLYSDDNDLISSLKRKIYLPVYVFRTKRLVVKTRTTRSAVVECPWQDGTFSSTGTDFYPKKPSDKQTVDVSIGGDNVENHKRNEENLSEVNLNRSKKEIGDFNRESELEEDINTAESAVVFRPLFSYRRKNYRYRF